MNLIIDAGNTCVKMAIFEGGHLLQKTLTDKLSQRDVQSFTKGLNIHAAIFSSVAAPDALFIQHLEKKFRVLVLDHQTKLPVKNHYQTPETLGTDRIACAAGAFGLFPGCPVLSVDAGTCIKYDFVTAHGEYKGGAISPGIKMRISALHNFTARLPLLEISKPGHFIGKNTEASILSGVLTGATEEMKGFIQLYTDKYPHLKVILTGGDMAYFEKSLKNRIFAAPNLVMQGLNLILEYNAEK